MRSLLSDERNLKIVNDELILLIRDPNLFNAIKDGLEDVGGIVDLTLNASILRISGTALMQLLICIEEKDGEMEQLLELLRGKLPKDTKGNDKTESALSITEDLLQILENAADIAGLFVPVKSAVSIAKAVICIGQSINRAVKEKRMNG